MGYFLELDYEFIHSFDRIKHELPIKMIRRNNGTEDTGVCCSHWNGRSRTYQSIDCPFCATNDTYRDIINKL